MEKYANENVFILPVLHNYPKKMVVESNENSDTLIYFDYIIDASRKMTFD